MVTLTNNSGEIIIKSSDKSFTLKSDLGQTPTDLPSAHWKMNDNLATFNVIDSYGNNGTSQRNTEDMSVAGKINTALSFLGPKTPENYWRFNDSADNTTVEATTGTNLVSSVNTDEMSQAGKIQKALYFNGVVDGPTYLKAHYKINETSGVSVSDSSGNGKTGTSSVDMASLTTAGKIGNALKTHGNTSRYMSAHYRMNDNAANTKVYDSKNNYDGTSTGNTNGMSVDGKINTALDLFAGGHKTITFPNEIFSPTNSFAFAGWFYHKDYTYPKTSIDMRSNSNAYISGQTGWQVGHGYNATGVNIVINDGVNLVKEHLVCNVGSQPQDWLNTWVHLCVIFDRTEGLVKMYVNGVLQADTVDISSCTGNIGTNDVVLGNTAGWTLDADVDDLRFFINGYPEANNVRSMYNDGDGTELMAENIALPSNILNESTEVSVAFWAKQKSDNDNTAVTVCFSYGNNLGWIIRGLINGSIEYYVGNSRYDTGYTIDEQWHHHCFTHKGTTSKYYIDGDLIDERETKAIAASTTGENKIGSEYYHFNDGEIDDVRIYSKQLIDGEVKAIWADGNGSENTYYITSNQSTVLGDATQPNRSYAFWYNQNSVPSGSRVFRVSGTYLFINSSGKVRMSFYNGSSYSYTGSTTAGSNEEWNHCVLTTEEDGSDTIVKIYINGELDTNTTLSGNKGSTNPSIQIGYSDSMEWFRGLLDDFRIYDQVLTLKDIEAIYNDGDGTEVAGVAGDKVTVSNSGITNAPMACAFWIKTTDASGSIYQERGLPPNTPGGWKLTMQNGKLIFTSYTVRDYNPSHGTINDGQWHHVVVVMKSDFDVDYYIDGVLDSTATGTADMKGTEIDGVIGAEQPSGSFYPVPSPDLVGYLDDLRIYNRELSLNEIEELYSSGNGTEKEQMSEPIRSTLSIPRMITIKNINQNSIIIREV